MADSKKDQLSRILDQVDKKAQGLEKSGQQIVRDARSSRDYAGCTKDVIDNLPGDSALPSEEWSRQLSVWGSVLVSAENLDKAIQGYDHAFTAVSTASGYATSDLFYFYTVVKPLPPPSDNAIKNAKERFTRLVAQSPLKSEIKAAMVRLKLDIRGGENKSPLVLLEDTDAALNQPSTGEGEAVPVLIGLRSCIEATISELVRRVPAQEKTNKYKDRIIFIGRHSGRAGLDTDYFTNLSVDPDSFLNELSGTKQKEVSRDELLRQFDRGLLFLKALLDGIDESKLRS